MREFQLVGGPFDGAHGPFHWPTDPPVVWAAPDPTSPGPFKGSLTEHQRPGACPYNLADISGPTLTFVFSNLTDDGYLQLTEDKRVAARAVFDWQFDEEWV